MTLIAIAVILFSTILLILCLPVTYEIKKGQPALGKRVNPDGRIPGKTASS